MTDLSLVTTEKDRSNCCYLIFNPDNVISTRRELLEDIQAICFHAALREVPVIMINPNLIATAWNDFGFRSPLLIADFAQAYFACDDLFMLNHKEEWLGLVQRAQSGVDLFRLSTFRLKSKSPKSYARIESWSDGIPDNLRFSIVKQLALDPNFVPMNKVALNSFLGMKETNKQS
jgi:hypothetical protein